MALIRHLSRAPITEALIDIQVESPISIEKINSCAASLAGTSGKTLDLWETSFALTKNANEAPKADHTDSIVGRRIDFSEIKQVILLKKNSYTFSKLAPYENWDAMLEPAMRGWEIYSNSSESRDVTRVALRYVNMLRLPLPLPHFNKYLVSPPAVPAALPQGLAGFLTQVQIPFDNDLAIVTLSLERSNADDKSIGIIFDIDVFQQSALGRLSKDGVIEVLNRLRAIKNKIFFEYLQEKTVEMYV